MSLTEDLVVEILLRLPVLSLLRFRSVCKSWYRLIKSPLFVHKYSSLRHSHSHSHSHSDSDSDSDSNNSVIVVKRFSKEGNLVINCYSDYDSLTLSNSHSHSHSHSPCSDWLVPDIAFDIMSVYLLFGSNSNGIACLTNYVHDIALVNPSLREFRRLPHHPFDCPVGFDARIIGVGFGFDDTTHDFKIVRLVDYHDSKRHNPYTRYTEAQLCNLTKNSWKSLARLPSYKPNSPCRPHSFNSPLFFKGFIHWTIRASPPFLLTFHVSTELFREVQCPPELEYGFECGLFLFDKSKSIIALVYYNIWTCEKIDVWLMKEYGVAESWTKHCSITPPLSTTFKKPLSFWGSNKLIILTSNAALISYDLSTGIFHHLRQYASPEPGDAAYELVKAEPLVMFQTALCAESLVSLKDFKFGEE